MAGELSIFDEGGSSVPAHIAAAFGAGGNSDMTSGVSVGFPMLSYKGKAWHVVQGDNRTLVAGEDGEPRSSIEVVILKSNPHVSKVFYEGGYVEGSDARPTCYSHDGIQPAADVASKQAAKCAICPKNQWGSRITESGAKGKECSDSRRLAVAPSGELENPMLLRIPAASLKELVAYATMLDRRKTPYQAVVTKIGFDHTVAYQKLTFKPIRWLDVNEVNTVAAVIEGPVVQAIIGDATSAAETSLASDLDAMEGERPANVAKLAAPSPARAKALVNEADVAALLEPEKAKPKAAGFGADEAKAAMTELVKETVAKVAPTLTPAQKRLADMKAEMARLEAEAEAETAPPAVEAVEAVKPKRDHSKLLAEASASLDDVLGILDDE